LNQAREPQPLEDELSFPLHRISPTVFFFFLNRGEQQLLENIAVQRWVILSIEMRS
jgi:hypothetical protein